MHRFFTVAVTALTTAALLLVALFIWRNSHSATAIDLIFGQWTVQVWKLVFLSAAVGAIVPLGWMALRGLARHRELSALRRRVADLERESAGLRDQAARTTGLVPADRTPPRPSGDG